LGGHLAWLDATYDRYVALGDIAGSRLNNAPEWSGRLARAEPERGPARDVSLRAASRWQSKVLFTPFNDAVQRQSPYGLLELSAELRRRPGSAWRARPSSRRSVASGSTRAAFVPDARPGP